MATTLDARPDANPDANPDATARVTLTPAGDHARTHDPDVETLLAWWDEAGTAARAHDNGTWWVQYAIPPLLCTTEAPTFLDAVEAAWRDAQAAAAEWALRATARPRGLAPAHAARAAEAHRRYTAGATTCAACHGPITPDDAVVPTGTSQLLHDECALRATEAWPDEPTTAPAPIDPATQRRILQTLDWFARLDERSANDRRAADLRHAAALIAQLEPTAGRRDA